MMGSDTPVSTGGNLSVPNPDFLEIANIFVYIGGLERAKVWQRMFLSSAVNGDDVVFTGSIPNSSKLGEVPSVLRVLASLLEFHLSTVNAANLLKHVLSFYVKELPTLNAEFSFAPLAPTPEDILSIRVISVGVSIAEGPSMADDESPAVKPAPEASLKPSPRLSPSTGPTQHPTILTTAHAASAVAATPASVLADSGLKTSPTVLVHQPSATPPPSQQQTVVPRPKLLINHNAPSNASGRTSPSPAAAPFEPSSGSAAASAAVTGLGHSALLMQQQHQHPHQQSSSSSLIGSNVAAIPSFTPSAATIAALSAAYPGAAPPPPPPPTIKQTVPAILKKEPPPTPPSSGVVLLHQQVPAASSTVAALAAGVPPSHSGAAHVSSNSNLNQSSSANHNHDNTVGGGSSADDHSARHAAPAAIAAAAAGTSSSSGTTPAAPVASSTKLSASASEFKPTGPYTSSFYPTAAAATAAIARPMVGFPQLITPVQPAHAPPPPPPAPPVLGQTHTPTLTGGSSVNLPSGAHNSAVATPAAPSFSGAGPNILSAAGAPGTAPSNGADSGHSSSAPTPTPLSATASSSAVAAPAIPAPTPASVAAAAAAGLNPLYGGPQDLMGYLALHLTQQTLSESAAHQMLAQLMFQQQQQMYIPPLWMHSHPNPLAAMQMGAAAQYMNPSTVPHGVGATPFGMAAGVGGGVPPMAAAAAAAVAANAAAAAPVAGAASLNTAAADSSVGKFRTRFREKKDQLQ